MAEDEFEKSQQKDYGRSIFTVSSMKLFALLILIPETLQETNSRGCSRKQSRGDEYCTDDEDFYIYIGGEPDSDFCEQINLCVEKEIKNGLPADISPVVVETETRNVSVPFKSKKLQNRAKIFMNKFIKQLIEMRSMHPNTSSKWASSLLILSKPSKIGKYRFKIDLRGVRSATVMNARLMSHIESELMGHAIQQIILRPRY
eukprot:IDg4025t1